MPIHRCQFQNAYLAHGTEDIGMTQLRFRERPPGIAVSMRRTHREIRQAGQRLVAASQDLLLPRSCVVCGQGRDWLCPRHQREAAAGPAGQESVRMVGNTRLVSARPYNTLEQRIVLGYKESGLRTLIAPITDWLISALSAITFADETVTLVPVPSSARSRVDRGTDTWFDVCAQAGASIGARAEVRPLLRLRRSWRPAERQKRLNRAARLRNTADRFVAVASPGAAPTLSHSVILVDDVATTGATIQAGVRALHAAGIPCTRAATACAVLLAR